MIKEGSGRKERRKGHVKKWSFLTVTIEVVSFSVYLLNDLDAQIETSVKYICVTLETRIIYFNELDLCELKNYSL